MTTTAYDQHFIASDIAFTDNNDNVTLDIPFRKVKRIGDVVFGMAGCLRCMIDFSNEILAYVKGDITDLKIPDTITNQADRDFIVILYINGICIKISKLKQTTTVIEENITNTATVIGSGSQYVQTVMQDCPNAIVAVLEAIKHDKYTDGEVKYSSVRREDVHNLEVLPMINTNLQVAGLQNELDAANDFLNAAENVGKSFKASTEVFHVGSTATLPLGTGMQLLKDSLDKIKSQ